MLADMEGEAIKIFDPETVPRTVSAVEVKLVRGVYESSRHTHPKAQLIIGMKGMVTCEAANSLWIVPSDYAVWIPGEVEHAVRGSGELDLYVVFIDTHSVLGLPSDHCMLSISPLLRELIREAARLPYLYDLAGPHGRLVQTMLDQLAIAHKERLHLPLPADDRLRRIAMAIAREPSDKATMGDWAKRTALSERTLSRLVPQQTGMSFRCWRQQLQVMIAIERLSAGEAVHVVAIDLGFESTSAFISMFRKVLGKPPGRYLAERKKAIGGER